MAPRKKPPVTEEVRRFEREFVTGLHRFEKFVVKEGEAVEHAVLHAGRRLRKFGPLEIIEIFVGAIILMTILAFQGDIWVWAITSPWQTIAAWNLVVLAAVYVLLYISGYVRARRHHPLIAHSVSLRLGATYAVCFAIASVYLTIFRPGEWANAALALKQALALLAPAVAGGAVADWLLE